jgi:hypothetical protein
MVRRLPATRYVVFGLVLLVLVGAPVAATRVRWNGSLGYGYGNGVGIPVRVGQPFSIGLAYVNPSHRVRIEAVRLHGARGALKLIGVVALPPGSGGVGADRAFPPRYPRVKMRPAAGAVVPAHARVELVVGLQATAAGVFGVRGVDVLYRERWHGIELRRRTHTGLEIEGCAAVTSARYPRCRVPQLGR